MSKIDDALLEIKQYLAGNDRSDTPAVRNASAVYAQACEEINRKLAECREFIDRGQLAEAQKIDIQMTPPLSERAEKLLLDPSEFKLYNELCALYNYTQAPDIDRATLAHLQQESGNNEEILKELATRWRKIARTGSNPEKIKLLRQIIKVAPASDQIWASNLAGVERQWVNDLMKEADKAIKENDGGKITKIYMALTDPQLLKPVPQEVIAKLQPEVQKHQQELLDNDLANKRTELFNAYSAQNIDLISARLREYDMLTTNPLYRGDPETENAVQEVRQYLQQQISIRNTERFHKEKLAELIKLLDQHEDYVLIENAYSALQKTDIPLENTLKQRVMTRREEYLQEINRKHIRKVVYSVLGAAVILLLAVFAFHVVQSTRTLFSYQKSMNELMASGNYRGIIKLYDEIKVKNPVLLQFGKLSALRAEAEKSLKNQSEIELKVNDLLTRAEQLLKNQIPHLEELKRIQKSLTDLQAKNISAELVNREQKMNFAIRRLEFTTQQNLDQEYIAQHNKCLKTLEECKKLLNNNTVSLNEVQNRIVNTMNFMQNLTDNSPKVSDNIRQSRNTMIQEQGKALLSELKNTGSRRQLMEALNQPKTFTQYCDALKRLPMDAPDLANGAWKTMLNDIYEAQSLANGATLSIYSSHAELDKAINDLQITSANNCFIRDITRMLPDKYFKVKYPDALTRLRSELSALYNCYELTFADQDNILWHFYSAEKPQLDKSRTSRIPKALAISVMLLPGAEGKFLPFLVERDAKGKIIYQPGKFPEMALPDKFIKLVNMQSTSQVFPKAKQHTLLENALRSIQNCHDINQLPGVIAEQLNRIANAESVNIFAQAYLLRRLLDVYALTSDFNRMAVNKPCFELDDTASHLYRKWYTPTIMAENPDTVKKLKEYFKKFSAGQLEETAQASQNIYKLALARGIIPGGIVLYDRSGHPTVHYFNGQDTFNELWFYTAADGSKPAGWIALEKQSNLDKANRLINFSFALPHGTVFFVPTDGRSTAELAKEIKADAAQRKINVLAWPESWPLNKR